MADVIRRLDPPRAVEVLHEGVWVSATQKAWIRQPDGSWKADVEYTVRYDWGPGKHVRAVPEEHVRLPS